MGQQPPVKRARAMIVVGGGCYGHLHASRLLTAKDRGRIDFETLVVVDRAEDTKARRLLGDRPELAFAVAPWDDYLDAYFVSEADPEDQFVPAPLAPHLLYGWLARHLARALPDRTVTQVPVTHTFEQPYARHGGDGAFYFSFADWLCPVSCIEPARCPAIKAPRTWEQEDFLRDFVARTPAVTALATFVCRHYAWGVGTVPIAAILEARDRLLSAARRPEPSTLLVGTVSACHGALGQVDVAAAIP